MKIFVQVVTALLMICAIATAAPAEQRTDHKEIMNIPLAHELPSELQTCAVDHGALSARTGFRVRSPLAAERFWVVRVMSAGQRLIVTLHRPDGAVVASKPLVAKQMPCRALVELVAVLLAAHVPEVLLNAPPADPATASRPVQPIPTVPRAQPIRPAPTAPTALPTLAAPATPRAPAASAIGRWYAGVGGGVTGLNERPAVLGMARAYLLLWRYLAAGSQVLVSHRQHDVADGQASIWAVDGRLTAGLFVRHQHLAWSLGALVGGRLSHGAAEGLYLNGSGSVGALGLGFCGEMWMPAGRHLRLGLGTNVVFFVPRAAFDVTGVGQVYRNPLPMVEAHLSVGWES